MSGTPREEHVACVDLACSLLDAVEEYSIAEGDVSGLLVLHGLAMYARDTARSASALLADGQTLAASALTRVVIEHAVLAQWLKVDPETRGSLFLQQSEVERHRWFDVVLAADFDLIDPPGTFRPGHPPRHRRFPHRQDVPSMVAGGVLDTGPNPPGATHPGICLLYTSPSPRDGLLSRMPSSA